MFQNLTKNYNTDFEVAEKYFGIISIATGLNLTKRQVGVLSYLAVNKGLDVQDKKYVAHKLNTTIPTISNTLSSLKRKRLIGKDGRIYKVNKLFDKDYTEIKLLVSLRNEGKENISDNSRLPDSGDKG